MNSSLYFGTVAAAIGFLLGLVAAGIGFFTLFKKFRFQTSSVAPSSLSHNWTHQVFPSFRGEDVRRDFLSHIKKEFERKGITPFVDNEITRGEFIGPALIQAIRGSKIAIILLSRNYASSSWCLDELAEIMKCREELDQTVMAVFYKVDPSEVKKLTGDFGKVFRKTCVGKTKEDIERWRQALAKVATIAGYHSNNWDNESAMISEIAIEISNKLSYSTSSNDFVGLIGMRVHLEKMEPLLCIKSEEVRMIGIWGPSGIGKTTIARVIFNQISESFQLCVFMENIKDNYPRLGSDDYSVKLRLQQHLMSQITNHKDFENPHLGIVQDRLREKKVLIILDGVDHLVQLDAMAKETWWFGPGSRIIITTTDHKLLRAHGINHQYQVDFPTTNEALQIFCMNAFGQKSPKDGFENLALEVAYLAGKLPLGLRVMGSHFRRMSKQEWTNALPKLRRSINTEIESILKFSYDSLDHEDKNLFLHIACLFNYSNITKVEEHLAEKFLDVRQGLEVLAEKSLISINRGSIDMHSLLAQLGRDIVRKQSVCEPGQRQFLVDGREICELLADDAAGSRSILGIDFSFSAVKDKLNMSARAFEGMSNLRYITFGGERDKLHLPCGLDYLPRKLQLLHWIYFPMTSLSSIVNSEFLIEVSLRHSKLEKLWEGTRSLRNLRWLDLSCSVNLKELPDLSTATKLERLNLGDCSSLMKLPSTKGYTNNLQMLDLRYCSSLIDLPSFIGDATNLELLHLGGCSSLVKVPSSIGNALKLKILYLEGCSSLVEIPSSLGNVITNFQQLDLSCLSCLLELPSWIGNASNLEELNLSRCLNLVELPVSIGNLQKLRWLSLQDCSKLEILPTNINLESLYELDLTGCSSLKHFPEISTNIEVLHLMGTAVEEVPSSIRSWSHLEKLQMPYSENLKEYPQAFDSITLLSLSAMEVQEIPPWIKRFSCLDRLILKGCRKLVSIPPIPDSLSTLDAEDCESLERLDCSFHNPKICLIFSKCFKLNQEARDLIIQTPTSEHAVLPGVKVPAYFPHRAATGASLTIKFQEEPLPTSMKFKACIMLVHKGEEAGYDKNCMEGVESVFIRCRKSKHMIYPLLEEHLYIFEVEAEVTSSENLFEFTLDRNDWKVGECGLLQLLETA